MKEKLIRWRFLFDKDKEEQWLNEMASQGWSMSSFFAGRYTFEKTAEREYLYQVELLPRNAKEKQNYFSFLQEEMGVEIVQEWGVWVFLRRKASEGSFELYTDSASKAQHYGKIARMFFAVSGLEFAIGLFETIGWIAEGEPQFLWLTLILYALGLVLLRQGVRFRNKQKKLEE